MHVNKLVNIYKHEIQLLIFKRIKSYFWQKELFFVLTLTKTCARYSRTRWPCGPDQWSIDGIFFSKLKNTKLINQHHTRNVTCCLFKTNCGAYPYLKLVGCNHSWVIYLGHESFADDRRDQNCCNNKCNGNTLQNNQSKLFFVIYHLTSAASTKWAGKFTMKAWKYSSTNAQMYWQLERLTSESVL